MASEIEHTEFANRTNGTIAHLLVDRRHHSPWIAIAAFYKALHVVEAVFACDRAVGHTTDHSERRQRLETIRKYQHIAEHYLPLYRISRIARYMMGHASFDKYMPPDVMVEKVLKHYLRQVETSARKFLPSSSTLIGIESITS